MKFDLATVIAVAASLLKSAEAIREMVGRDQPEGLEAFDAAVPLAQRGWKEAKELAKPEVGTSDD